MRGVYWRRYLDFALLNVPFYLQPSFLAIWTIFFFFFAAPARRSIVANLAVILPGSSWLMNHARAFRTLMNFAWTISEAANYKLTKAEYHYDIVGEEFLDQLAAGGGAIVLTAHMGSYDLGAALFAQKFGREIRMVRAPEPDAETAQHLQQSVHATADGAVKVAYNTEGALLSFDLLSALRSGEIVSIQGDRVIPGLAHATGDLFGHPVILPSGPFTLALVARVPIYPLFIARTGYRRYAVIVCEPIHLTRTTRSREEDIAAAVPQWCAALEKVIARHWDQWFAFGQIFVTHAQR